MNKGLKCFVRPLIPIFLCFSAGILAAQKVVSSAGWITLPLFISVILSLLSTLFISSKSKIFCLLIAFFLAGVLLNLKNPCPSPLAQFAEKREKALIAGTVLEPARIIKGVCKFQIKAQGLSCEDKIIPVNENLLVTIFNHGTCYLPGDKIRFPARLRPFKNFYNPGCYDYETAMKLKGLSCAASVSDGRCVMPAGPGHLPFPKGIIEKLQRPVRNFFKQRLAPQDFALYRALILGERQGISRKLREPFNKTGLGHLLAVSGLHIGIVAWVSFFLFKWLSARSYYLLLRTNTQALAALLTCFPVTGYTALAGFQVSSQRAMIMVLAFLCSLILKREKDVWSTLALAGLVILSIDPQSIFSVSFQLSFSAVAGILWLAPPIMNKLGSPDNKPHKNVFVNYLRVYFTGLIAVSIAASIFLLPVISYYFHQVSLVAVPANLTAIPILGLWIIPFGLLSVLALPFSLGLAGLFLYLGTAGLHLMTGIIRFWSGLPWSSIWVITPDLFEIIIFYALIFSIFFFKRWKWARIGLLVTVILLITDIGYWSYRVCFNKELRVTFLDVGQANSALVEFPGGKKMLIDGGGVPMDNFNVGKLAVAPFLWHSKILHIDYIVLSHPNADHMNGLRFIAKAFHPQEFWYNGDMAKVASFRELISIIETKKIKKVIPADLTNGIKINGVRIDLLHPAPGADSLSVYGKRRNLNNNSLVLKISFAGKSFLFPGDIEKQGERILISNAGASLKSDVLLSPHHGSRNSSTMRFLRMVKPEICVISSGEGNHFGFPHKQTLLRLKKTGSRIIRIDRKGAVQFRVEPGKFDLTTFRKEINRE